MAIITGHITIERKILNWEWYTDQNVFHLFMYFLLKANWKDSNWRGIKICRGQLITGRMKISTDTGLTERQIRTCMDKLKSTNEITVKSTSKYSVITICKYDSYQDKTSNSDQQKVQQTTSKKSDKSPTNDQQATTYEEELIINNKKKNIIINKKGFKNFPIFSDFNGLPEIKTGTTIELVRIVAQKDLQKEDVDSLWEIFKVQNLTGENFYKDEDAIYSHFQNWCKNHDYKKDKNILNGNKKSTPRNVSSDYND